MISDKGKILSKIIPTIGVSKAAILTNEASTIVEKYKNPKITSTKKVKTIREMKSGGKAKASVAVAESFSRPKASGKNYDYVKNTIEKVSPQDYKRKKGVKFTEYLGVPAPKADGVKLVEPEEEIEVVEYSVITDQYDNSPDIRLSSNDVAKLVEFLPGDYLELELSGTVQNFSYEGKDDGSERYIYNLIINGTAS